MVLDICRRHLIDLNECQIFKVIVIVLGEVVNQKAELVVVLLENIFDSLA